MKPCLWVGILMLMSAPGCLLAQLDNAGSGRAILFDGVDDYIDLGNIYDDVNLPLTISVWVYVDPDEEITQYPIFDSQDNSSVYNGFTFVGSTLPHIGFTIGDGRGGNNLNYRRSRAGYFQTLGRWIYMTAVAKSGYDIELYMNGKNVSGDYQGKSSYPMNSDSPGEVAKIGYLYSNDLTFRFKGVMDELRIWNRALSENEIRETMCRRLKGNEAGLIGYWNFDETSGNILMDRTPNGFNGVLKGNPVRVFSGAPLGDESVFLYTADWAGRSVSNDVLTVDGISSGVYGAHIYTVSSSPSQTSGIDAEERSAPYYGVFLASDEQQQNFDLSFRDGMVCSYYQRVDNSVAEWNVSDRFSTLYDRIELLKAADTNTIHVDLGPGITVCDEKPALLTADEEPDGKFFTWSNGATTPVITVSDPGVFGVQVRSGCAVATDTIEVIFAESPPAFSLGENEIVCEMTPRTLVADADRLLGDGYQYLWSDGSHMETLDITEPGTYWLKVSTACGTAVDSITFTRKELREVKMYNFMSPNRADAYNQFFVLDDQLLGAHLAIFNRWGNLLYESSSYQNTWDGGDLPAGIYFYTVEADCLDPVKGTLTIAR